MSLADVPRHPGNIAKGFAASLVGAGPSVVLEVGANDGTDSVELLAALPGARLHCFEPDPRPAARHRVAVHDPRCTLHQVALGARTGTAEFHPSVGGYLGREDWDFSGSLRPPTGHLQNWPGVKFGAPVSVTVETLDDFCARWLPNGEPIDFLWADVQGAEGDLIAGGAEAFARRVRFFYTEFYDSPMYAGQPSLAQIMALLPGYACLGIYDGCNALLARRA